MGCPRVTRSTEADGNIGNYIADESFYKDHVKILKISRGDYRDRFIRPPKPITEANTRGVKASAEVLAWSMRDLCGGCLDPKSFSDLDQ